MQNNQHHIGQYEFEVKPPEERYDTKMYNRLRVGEMEIKELSFDSNYERLKQNYVDVFEGGQVRYNVYN